MERDIERELVQQRLRQLEAYKRKEQAEREIDEAEHIIQALQWAETPPKKSR